MKYNIEIVYRIISGGELYEKCSVFCDFQHNAYERRFCAGRNYVDS